MDARAIDIMHELECTNTAIQITIEERDAVCREAQEWRTSATMRRAEADELRNTLAQLRELYADREHDLAHEFKRANDAEAERDALRTWIIEADAAFNLDGIPAATIGECAGLVRMCHEGAAALSEVAALREQVADLRGAITILRAENHMLTQAQYRA